MPLGGGGYVTPAKLPDGTPYNVPWMSIAYDPNDNTYLPHNYVSINHSVLDPSIDDNSVITLSCTNLNILINGNNPLTTTYALLKSWVNNGTNLDITGTTQSNQVVDDHLQYPIKVTLTQTGSSTTKIVGMLQVSCQKIVKKKVVFVNVNTENVTRQNTFDFNHAINFLNLYSYNQLFRKWEIVSTVGSQNLPNTLDLTTASHTYTSTDDAISFIRNQYALKYGIDFTFISPSATKSPSRITQVSLQYALFLLQIYHPL